MTDQSNRIQSLDQIRGLALMGILVVNYMAFTLPLDAYMFPSFSPLVMTQADDLSWWGIKTFFQEKFISLFAMLFGVSLGLISLGQGDKGVLSRRLISLLFIGLAHGALIWGGDVLFLYAVSGLIMLMWLKLSPRQLIIGGIVYYLLGALIISGLGVMAQAVKADIGITKESVAAIISDYRGPFAQSLKANFNDWSYAIMASPVFLPSSLGLMRIGLGLYRLGFFEPEKLKNTRLVLMVIMPIGLSISGIQAFQIIQSGYDPLKIMGDLGVFGHLLAPVIALGYASIIIVLGRSWFMGLFGSYGRMAFSHYLMQSIIMTMIFYGGRFPAVFEPYWPFEPTPWMGQAPMSHVWVVAFGVIAFQLIFGAIWQSIFRYGPFEYIWRCISYGRIVSILKPKLA
jgi:uncharacterized protein